MPDHPSWPAELVEKAAAALNEHLSSSGDWSDATPAMVDAVLSALSGDLVPREERTEEEAVERGATALCRYVFPGCLVPRVEMARAVLDAAASPDWPDVSDKRIITADSYRSSSSTETEG